jgi:hypothetical protein
MTNPETILKPKWCFEFYLGTKRNPTYIRSGCVGADTRDEAVTMIRTACLAESNTRGARLLVIPTRLTWPHIVS